MININEYKKNGYVLLENFIGPDEIDTIRNEAKMIFSIQLKRLGLIESMDVSEREFEQALYKLFELDIQLLMHCGKQLQHLISLHRLALSEKIISTLKELGISFPIINIRPVIFFNNPKVGKKEVDHKKPAHQDFRTTQGSIDSIVVWIPLIDIPKKLGALEIIPGSHMNGLMNYENDEGYHTLKSVKDDEFISVEVKKGDALFFSTLLVHQSGNNITDEIRWSCHFRYNNINDPTFIERGFPHTYIYRPQDELVTPDFPRPEDMKKSFSF
jgi:ectoine hydroxylase-related dioxygenase (phytanoyl-CoA dioxygenase family)